MVSFWKGFNYLTLHITIKAFFYLNNFFLIFLVRNLTDGFLARPLSGLSLLAAVLVPSNRSIYFSRRYSSLALAHSFALRLTNEPKMENNCDFFIKRIQKVSKSQKTVKTENDIVHTINVSVCLMCYNANSYSIQLNPKY